MFTLEGEWFKWLSWFDLLSEGLKTLVSAVQIHSQVGEGAVKRVARSEPDLEIKAIE